VNHKCSFLAALAVLILTLALPSLALAASYTVTDLGTLGGTDSSGYGINVNGQVTGFAHTSGNAAQHAFLYDPSSGMVDLNALVDPLSGWVLSEGRAINDSGQITGYGSIDGVDHAFLLTPVPEPSTFVLIVSGLLSVGMLIGRQRRSRRRDLAQSSLVPPWSPTT
jgi:probable HAF family extracellular repeat protein